jgi:hypothetical protein
MRWLVAGSGWTAVPAHQVHGGEVVVAVPGVDGALESVPDDL